MTTSQLDAAGPATARAIFGDWLYESRGAQPLAAVATRADLSVAVYRDIELGARAHVTIEELERIAAALRLDQGEVLRRARDAGF